jgi:hypothetical protein
LVPVAVVEQLVGLHQLAAPTGQPCRLVVVQLVHTTHHMAAMAAIKDQETELPRVVLVIQT